MPEKLRFYLNHSFNDLRVNGQRTLFALLCIAAGVAAIVSLQTLGIMVEDTLTGSLQETNQGDIRISASLDSTELSDRQMEEAGADGLIVVGESFEDYFSEDGIATIQNLLVENYGGGFDTLTYQQILPFSAGISSDRTEETEPLVVANSIDVEVFPLYGELETLEGQPLSEVITAPNHVVINETLAGKLDAQIGDVLSIGGATSDFTLTGITSNTTAGDFDSTFLGGLLGAYYVDHDALQFFPDQAVGASTIFIRLSDTSLEGEINRDLLTRYPYLQTQTTQDLLELNETISSGVTDLVSTMGLLSMLIGGIGIINTMQVIVRRRTVEVAVLKTIGLQGRQVTVLFLVEAFVMGVIGSIFGVLLGWGLTFIIKGAVEPFTGPLPFRLAPGPAITGIIVGVLITTIFGFLPTLSAGQVRPGLVLRPTQALVPKAGVLQSILALLLVIVVVSIIAAGFIGRVAALVVPGAFVAVGIIYLLLSLVIWLVGRFFPSFGSVDLKVSLRSMLASRPRVASTLLALVIGVFVLSVVTLGTGALLRQFQNLLELDTGGNVIAFGIASSDETITRIEDSLEGTEGVESYSALAQYNVRIVEVEATDGTVRSYEEIKARVDELGPLNGFGPPEETNDQGEVTTSTSDFLDFSFGSIDARNVDSNLPDLPFYAGRQLTAADADRDVIVITRDSFTANAGIEVGDKITFAFESSRLFNFGLANAEAPTRTYEVVGIIDRTTSAGFTGVTAPNYAPRASFPEEVNPSGVSVVAQVDEENVQAVMRQLQDIPGVLPFETRLLNDLVNALVDQFTALPILVATLTLVVGGIVIANSVALTTFERRREIAVMKAVGLQRERVLGMLLLENGLMGLIGGVIGVGIGLVMLIVGLQTLFAGIDTSGAVPYDTAFLLMLMCVGIAVGAAMLSAWGASGEKPLNVLRYE